MKNLYIITAFMFTYHFCLAQNTLPDSLKNELALAKSDTSKVVLLAKLCFIYSGISADSGLMYGQEALNLARQIDFKAGEVRALTSISSNLLIKGNPVQSLKTAFEGLKIAEDNHLIAEKAEVLSRIAGTYGTRNLPKANEYFRKSYEANEVIGDKESAAREKMNLGVTFFYLNQLDSALFYLNQGFNETKHGVAAYFYRALGRVHIKLGHDKTGFDYYQKGIERTNFERNKVALGSIDDDISEY